MPKMKCARGEDGKYELSAALPVRVIKMIAFKCAPLDLCFDALNVNTDKMHTSTNTGAYRK